MNCPLSLVVQETADWSFDWHCQSCNKSTHHSRVFAPSNTGGTIRPHGDPRGVSSILVSAFGQWQLARDPACFSPGNACDSDPLKVASKEQSDCSARS